MATMLEFESCCFCVPLRLGCLIIGYLNLIGNGLLFVMALIWIILGIAAISSGGAVILAIGVILFLAVAVVFVINIFLLVGLHKERPGYVKAYLICVTIFMVLYIVLFIANACTTYQTVGYIIGTIIEILISIYFILVIRSHHLKMVGGTFNSA